MTVILFDSGKGKQTAGGGGSGRSISTMTGIVHAGLRFE